ncbi:hypothetical protein JCM10207_002105 [Rhodosporidiobolus poonsookiae]
MDTRLPSLRQWLTTHSVHLDPRLDLVQLSPSSATVRATAPIPPDCTVARIPKPLVLSHRTSSLPSFLPSSALAALSTAPDALRLALHVLHELLLGPASRWAVYLDSCPPPGAIPLAVLWKVEGEARRWLRGTQAERELESVEISQSTLTSFFHSHVLPLLSPFSPSYSLSLSLSLATWHHAYALVSTRAFQVDTFHCLALVPLADVFDHEQEGCEGVQFVAERWVCGECGALGACKHDEDSSLPASSSAQPEKEDEQEEDTCDLVTTRPLLPGETVFNHYGPGLSNAHLLVAYGFLLEANEHDRVDISREEAREALGLGEPEALALDSAALGESDLVTPPRDGDPGALFVDADARPSPALFGLLASSAGTTPARLEQLVETSEAEKPLADVDREVLSRAEGAVRRLVEARQKGQCEPEMGAGELLELAEVRLFPSPSHISSLLLTVLRCAEQAEQDEHVRLAMEFLAGERLILERLQQGWTFS